MARVTILPPHIANQIAAGEVVERPASVVKELVENALDAGASRIRLELEDGGKRLIRVVDDGCGMAPEDLELAVERHATSKIAEEADLCSIRTLGFRGEALPSIGAVARLAVTSRPADRAEGRRVQVTFGRGKRVSALGAPSGTTVEVEDLFLEIPARRRFLKTRQTEMGHIAQTLRTFAAAYPEVDFELRSEGRDLFRSLPGVQGAMALWPLVGEDLAAKLLPVEGRASHAAVSGFVSPPAEARSSSRAFYFFLNRRPITNRLLWRALNEASKGALMRGLYPAGALFLEVPAEAVDVNVHPTKQEVRFAAPDEVYRMVFHALRRALAGGGGTVAEPPPREEPGPGPAYRFPQARPQDRVAEAPSGLFASGGAAPSASFAPFSSPAPAQAPPFAPEAFAPFPEKREAPEAGPASLEGLRLIGQFAESYLVAQGPGGLVLLDQHAAHEAVLFTRLSRRLSEEGDLSPQPLLFPMVFERAPRDVAVLAEQGPALRRLGIEAEPFGPAQVAVRGLPDFLAHAPDAKAAVAAVLDRLAAAPEQEPQSLVHELLASVACHAAVKARQGLDRAEMEALIADVVREGVRHCPHGRPIAQVLTLGDLERRFGRA